MLRCDQFLGVVGGNYFLGFRFRGFQVPTIAVKLICWNSKLDDSEFLDYEKAKKKRRGGRKRAAQSGGGQ